MTNTGAKLNRKHPTLFPYIKTGKSGIRIDFLPKVGPLDKKNIAFPFEILDYSDPLVHLVKARLVTDAGSEIEHLLILLQRDQVQPVKNISLPKTNPAINQCWQQAFSHYSRNEAFNNDCLIRLGEQFANNGRLLPFQPLLYCSFKKQFFPPPCPICGGLLDLCRDDKLLISTGLQPYSNSLRRYLYCPTCYKLAGETDFYTYLPSDQVRDHSKSQSELISELKKLAASATPTHRLPCRDCTEIDACHAPNGPMSHRVSPLAFYPFHMLVFKATSVNPADLLPLMTQEPGASPSENDSLDQSVDTASIANILRQIINQWQTEAAENPIQNREKVSLIDTAKRPSRPPPRESFDDPSTQASILAENPDLQETIIVSINRNQSPADEKPDVPSDADIPETMIIGASEPTKPESDHSGLTRGNRQSPPSSIPDTVKPQQANILPETIIVRPPESNSPGVQDQKISSHIMSNQPDGQKDVHPNIKFAFSATGSPDPPDSSLMTSKQHDISLDPDEKLLKTFTLGPDEKGANDLRKDRSSFSRGRNKARTQSRPGTEDKLARTIVVPVKEKGKDKK